MTVSELRTTITAIYPGNNWQAVIFSFYCGEWSFNKNFLSPLRIDDTSPSMRIFETQDGNLLAHDYGENKTYNIWSFVYTYHKNRNYTGEFNTYNVIALINQDMQLGMDSDDIFANPKIIPNLSDLDRISKTTKSNIEIAVYPKPWNDVDLWYWKPQGISLECASFFGIGAAQKAMFSVDNTNWYDYHSYKRNDPLYYYHFINSENQSKFKLLRPFCEDKQFKWRTNIDKADMSLVQGYRQLPEKGEVLFMTSSLKDVAALRMCGFYAIALHGEGYIPTQEFIQEMKSRFKYIFLLYDNDRVGREKSNQILSLFNLDGELFVPELTFPNGKSVKDPSDFNKYNEGNNVPLYNLINSFLISKKCI